MLDPFTELSITLANPDVTLADFFKAVCVAVVKTIPNADRVSLWKFSQDKSDITCLALRVNQDFSQPTSLVYSSKRYPEYFKAILERHSILAIDARNHPDTSCFADSYFESESVFSLMDYVFENTFSPFGIICCESVGQYAKWGESEVEELKRIARIVSIFSNIRHLCD
jgi:hypothetical protein